MLAASTAGGERRTRAYARVPRQDELSLTPGRRLPARASSNETIHGIEYARSGGPRRSRRARAPACRRHVERHPRPSDRRRSGFDLIYAGAQKNIGPSGVTIVALKKELTERGRKDIPTVFQFRTAAANDSLYNTPPTFGIYLVRNVLQWLKASGGVAAAETRNRAKAKALYDAIDGSGDFYRGPVDVDGRSIMNVVWRLPHRSSRTPS